jgi:predicted phage tail protein
MKTVKLLGELGKKFGKQFKLDVKNPAEAVRALAVNLPDFQNYLMESEKRNVAYKVMVGKEEQGLDDLRNPSGKQIIKIVPVICGAGGGFGKVIIGAALIATAIYLPGSSLAWSSIAAFDAVATYATIATYVGTSLVIAGASQMLTPTPTTPNQNSQPDNKPSYVFNGAVNTTAQGYPVPVGYGRMIVGSAVISASIIAEELPI